jgi:hypothetical protein
MTLVQLVPQLPPSFEGVGGYAAALARALAQRGLASRFLVAAPGWVPAAADAGGLAASPIGERSPAAFARLLAASGADRLLLHYVNYGYQARGCPSWLVDGIASWRRDGGGRRLVTMFHEVYASGPPWRSSFWLSPLQRRLAARLLRASDAAVTSLDLYARMLGSWEPSATVVVAPVFSPVEEPGFLPAPAARLPRHMLLFGGRGHRQRAYGELRAELAAACRALAVAEIVDLGPALEALPAELDGIPVRALGPQPEEEVSAVLLRSYAGFLAYPAPFLAKSTVFAAYCAHGLVPVCAWPRRVSRRGMTRPPCWEPAEEPAPSDAAGLAARARAWYGAHDLASQAACFHALLRGAAGEERRQE